MKITGAIGIAGQVYRQGMEAEMEAAAEAADIDLTADRFAGHIAFGEDEAAERSYGEMTKEELVAMAEERGLEVTRSEGEGEPLKADFVAALEADDDGE